MTTIALKDWVLAADGRTSWGKTSMSSARKIRVTDGHAFAVSGDVGLIPVFHRWLEAGADPLARPVIQYAGGDKPGMRALVIVLSAQPSMTIYDEDFLEVELSQEGYYAIGSGQDLALGAMAHGANAIEAVVAACAHDPHSGLPISWFNALTGETGVVHG